MKTLLQYTILTQRLKNKFDALAENEQGVTAVEFALIAAPFFFLIFAIIEVGFIYILSSILEIGLSNASRDIRIGSFQTSGGTEASFKQAICDETFGFMNCDSNFYVDVRRITSFTGTSIASPISNGNLNSGSFIFDPAAADEIIVIRAFYEWNLFTPVISDPISNLNGGKRLIQANVVFRVEPYS